MGADAWVLLRALHLLAMALFVGGQLVLAVAVVPALRQDHREALRAAARRFAWASLAAPRARACGAARCCTSS